MIEYHLMKASGDVLVAHDAVERQVGPYCCDPAQDAEMEEALLAAGAPGWIMTRRPVVAEVGLIYECP